MRKARGSLKRHEGLLGLKRGKRGLRLFLFDFHQGL
jgi:hypothetical protein